MFFALLDPGGLGQKVLLVPGASWELRPRDPAALTLPPNRRRPPPGTNKTFWPNSAGSEIQKHKKHQKLSFWTMQAAYLMDWLPEPVKKIVFCVLGCFY